MATLGGILNQLAKKYDMSVKENDPSSYTVVVSFEGDRMQAISVDITHDDNDRSWMVVESTVGPLSDLDAELMLKASNAPGYTYVTADDEHVLVQAQIPLENCDVDLAKEMVMSVAIFADNLEEEYLGGDES